VNGQQTSVTSPLRRSYNAALFDGLDLPAPVDFWAADGLWSVLFDGPLTDAQVFAAWARMESTDDADETRRAALRAATPCCHSCALTLAYVLGDPLPDPPA
jgi:hypothetical protein